MATDATGTPTAKGIPKYNTVVDAPSGKGFNAAMDAIDTILSGYIASPGGIATGETIVWNGTAWARSSVTHLATVRPQDLTQDAATTGQALVWNGSIWAPGSGAGILDRSTGTTDVTNTTVETSVYTFTVPANNLGTNKMLRLTMLGDHLTNSTVSETFKVKFGGTTWFAGTSSSSTPGAQRKPWQFVLHIANLGATNSQMMTFGFLGGTYSDAADPTTGIGAFNVRPVNGTEPMGFGGISTLGTVDTTANQTLDITVQFASASANVSFRKRYAVLELI